MFVCKLFMSLKNTNFYKMMCDARVNIRENKANFLINFWDNFLLLSFTTLF